jgi:thiamine-monophosphate kinase
LTAPRGEFRLIADYLAGLDRGAGVVLGNGDDAAVLDLARGEQLVVSTDLALPGVHFPLAAPWNLAAFRAVACAASDLAAMGARPLAMTLNLVLPDDDAARLAALRRGLEDAAQQMQLPLVGGDLVRGPLSLGVQVLGAVPAGLALTRAGARPGDGLYVSGIPGEAAAGLAAVQGRLPDLAAALRAHLERRFWRPEPAFALGMALRGRATAAIDVSDGLLADAAHLARASGVALRIAADALPLPAEWQSFADREQQLRWALSGGDDYLLCFTLPEGEEPPPGCTRIGQVEAGEGVYCDYQTEDDGYRHF